MPNISNFPIAYRIRYTSRLNVTDAQWGAKGDGVVCDDLTTTASSDVVSRPGGFPGATTAMKIVVHGAGASNTDMVEQIVEVHSSFAWVRMAHVAAVSISGAAHGVYGTDDTAAINTCISEAVARGMDVEAPAGRTTAGKAYGTYLLAPAALITDDGIGNPNCIIHMPVDTPSPYLRRTVTIYGGPQHSPIMLGLTSHILRPNGGTVFYGAIAGSGAVPSVIGGSLGNNTSTLRLKHITIAVLPNATSAKGATLTAVNGISYASTKIDTCLAVVDTSIFAANAPTTSVAGFLLSGKDREAGSYIRNSDVWGGFKHAVRVSDHCKIQNFGSYGNLCGVLAGAAGHPWWFDVVCIHWNAYGIIFQNADEYGAGAGPSPFFGGDLYFEDRNYNPDLSTDGNAGSYPANKFYARDPLTDIHDSSGLGRGTIRVVAEATRITTDIGMTGGGSIKLRRLNGDPMVVQSNPGGGSIHTWA